MSLSHGQQGHFGLHFPPSHFTLLLKDFLGGVVTLTEEGLRALISNLNDRHDCRWINFFDVYNIILGRDIWESWNYYSVVLMFSFPMLLSFI